MAATTAGNHDNNGKMTASFTKLDAYSEIFPVVTDTLAALRLAGGSGGGVTTPANPFSAR